MAKLSTEDKGGLGEAKGIGSESALNRDLNGRERNNNTVMVMINLKWSRRHNIKHKRGDNGKG